MKNRVLKSLLGLALITLTFTGCDVFESADDVSFDIEIDVTFVTDENQEFENKTYNGDPVLLDITTNAEVKKYADKIKAVKLTKIEYRITDFASEPDGTPVTFSNGIMHYSAVGATSSSTLSTVGSVNLQTANNGDPAPLPIVQESFDALGELLLDEKQATVFTSGTLSHTPVSFNVPTTFYFTITANALE